MPPNSSPYRLPQNCCPMSHCGPLTANRSRLKISLRICTPLLPSPSFRRIWNDSSKSLYFFLLHKKVLNGTFFPPPVPTIAPSLTDQYLSINPSQPSRSLPLKNALVASSSSAARVGLSDQSARGANA